MKKWFKTNWHYFVGALAGAVAGYLYWQQIGCASGSCAITSSPVNSSVYGAVMGALMFSYIKEEIKKNKLKSINKPTHEI